MHHLITLFVIATLLCSTSAACTFEREIDGDVVECVGLGEEEDPRYVYEVNGWNIFWGILFSEMLFIPTIVVLTSAWACPAHGRYSERRGSGHRSRAWRPDREASRGYGR